MDDAGLQAQVLADLHAWGQALGPTLAPVFEQMWSRLQLDTPPGYFLHPLALPVLQLPAWVATGPAPEATPRVLAAAGSGAAGYLHVRLQDDLLDEGEGAGDAGVLMLAEALLARHHRLAAQAAGSHPDYWALSERAWLRYAEAMAREVVVRDQGTAMDEGLFDALLQRTDPLVLPGACLLAPAGTDALRRLEALVNALGRSHQLFTDAVDVEKDLRNGNVSMVLQRCGYEHGPDVVRRRLYLEGGFDAVVTEAVELCEQARAVARELGLPADAWLDRRLATMESIRKEAFSTLFSMLLGQH